MILSVGQIQQDSAECLMMLVEITNNCLRCNVDLSYKVISTETFVA